MYSNIYSNQSKNIATQNSLIEDSQMHTETKSIDELSKYTVMKFKLNKSMPNLINNSTFYAGSSACEPLNLSTRMNEEYYGLGCADMSANPIFQADPIIPDVYPMNATPFSDTTSISGSNTDSKTEDLIVGGTKIKYHKKMARILPGSDNSTPKERELRTKNIVAARVSRAKSKMREESLERNSMEARIENISTKQTIAAQMVYANKLLNLLDKEDENWGERWKRVSGENM